MYVTRRRELTFTAATLDMGGEIRPDLDLLPDLAARAALRLCGDGTLADRVQVSIAATLSRFARATAPWPVARLTMDLLWPVLTVAVRCAGTDLVEYFDVSGILAGTTGVPIAGCEVSW